MLKQRKGSIPLALFLSVARPVGLMDEIPFGQTKKKKKVFFAFSKCAGTTGDKGCISL